jgi:hypothetical protein
VIVLNAMLERQRATKRYANLRLRYRMTEEQYRRMTEEQCGKCKICNKSNAACVDHCHQTGAIRGLLCQCCNKGLGNFKDNPELLHRAIDYLCSPPPAAHSRRRSPPAAIGAPNGDGGVAGLRTKRRTR